MTKSKLAKQFGKCVFTLILGGLTALPAASSESGQPQVQQGRKSEIVALGEKFTSGFSQPGGPQGRVVFYRPEAARSPHTASIFVNGSYHTSLIAGAYSPLCLKPAAIRVGVRKIRVGEMPDDDEGDNINFNVKSGQSLYIRVREPEAGRWGLQAVAESEARAELARTRVQIHTISRVEGGEECSLQEVAQARPRAEAVAPIAATSIAAPAVATAATAESAKAQIPAPKRLGSQRFVIAGNKLFSGERSELSSSGVAEVNRLTAQLRRDYERIDSLSVIGHADPLCRNAQKLTRQQAEAVMSQLQKQGLRPPKSHVEGRRSADPIVCQCKGRQAAVTACNQPNRRVIVEVAGLRR